MATRKIQSTILRAGPFKFPVALLTATDAKGGLKFQSLHRKDGGSIKNVKTCSICNKTIGTADAIKQYAFEDGFSIEVTPEDFSDAFGNPSRNMSIKKFIPLNNVNPMLVEKSYYIIPSNLKDDGYSAFVEALYNSGSVGVVSLFFHTTEHLGIVRAISPTTLMVQQVEYPENLRIPPEIANIVRADAETVDLMGSFIGTRTIQGGSLDEFKDGFSKKMKKVLEKKRKTATAAVAAAVPTKPKTVKVSRTKKILAGMTV